MTPSEVTAAARLLFGLVIDDAEAERVAALSRDTSFRGEVDVAGRDIVSGWPLRRSTRLDELGS